MASGTKDSKVTIKIPRPLYSRIQKLIEGSGFSSVTDFIVYVLRDLVSVPRSDDEFLETLTHEEVLRIRERLRSLGYL